MLRLGHYINRNMERLGQYIAVDTETTRDLFNFMIGADISLAGVRTGRFRADRENQANGVG